MESADLLPSRRILLENLDVNFNRIKEQSIENVDELRIALGSKARLEEFATQSGIAADYLKILIREVKSYRQTPNKIKDFPAVPEDVVLKLESIGIKNTLQLFAHILTPSQRQVLSDQSEVDSHEIMRLTRLTDLSRIRWVNHTFAYVLLEAGYDSTEKVANADYKTLYEEIKTLNDERAIYKGHIGLHDMKLCVEAARDVSFEIEF